MHWKSFHLKPSFFPSCNSKCGNSQKKIIRQDEMMNDGMKMIYGKNKIGLTGIRIDSLTFNQSNDDVAKPACS